MKRSILSICAASVVGLSSLTFADRPTTAPASPPLQASGMRVEVFAFTSVAQPAQEEWTGKGIQESLQNDVSHTGAELVLPAHAAGGSDEPVNVARQNHADIAVVGTYQVAGDDIRVNGHLIDTATNSTIGSFAATGPQKNLFGVEDALGDQMRRLLPAPAAADQAQAPVVNQPVQPAPAQTIQPVQQPPTIYAQSPEVVSYPAPTVNYYYNPTPSYVYPYSYPYAYSGYPCDGYYGGVVIESPFFGINRGFGFHDRGFIGRSGFAGVHGNFSGSHFAGGGRSFGAPSFGGVHAGGGRR